LGKYLIYDFFVNFKNLNEDGLAPEATADQYNFTATEITSNGSAACGSDMPKFSF
jgi:hypothetical protein